MLARAGFEDVDPKEETSNSEEQATKQTGRKRKELKLLKTCNVKDMPICFIYLL